jgi:hypothetical protein
VSIYLKLQNNCQKNGQTEELVWSKYDAYLYDDCKVLKNLLNIQNEAVLNLADKYKFKNYKPVLHEYLED